MDTGSHRRIAFKFGFSLLVGAITLTFAVQPAAAQRGVGRMQGTIVDVEGNGLEGVVITATNPSASPNTRTAESASGGRWALVGFTRGSWTFNFSLPGYISYEAAVTVSAANRNPDLDVTLEVMPTEGGAALAAAGASNPELFNDGNALFEAGDYAGAIAKWQEFLLANPTLYIVQGNLGNAYRELGDMDSARAAYEALLAAEPANTMANYNIGEMHAEAGQIDEAMPYFEKVVETAPDDPAVYYNVAELYFSQQAMDQAIVYYQRALEVDPNYLSAHMQLGFAYVNAGDIPNAILAFEKFIEIAPEDDPQLALVQDVLAALRSE